MTHLGQRLSALIDGELETSERERVLVHMTRCASCRDEVTALRTLKQRMNALGEAAAGAGLTGRLLSQLSDLAESRAMTSGEALWPPPHAAGWAMSGDPAPEGGAASRGNHPEQRAGRYFLAGSIMVFLAGLGTAAVIAGGEPQARAPAPPVTPSVDVVVSPHTAGPPRSRPVVVDGFRPQPGQGEPWSGSAVDVTSLPSQP